MFKLIDDIGFYFAASAVIAIIAITLSYTGFGVFGVKTDVNVYKCNCSKNMKKQTFSGVVSDKHKGSHDTDIIELSENKKISKVYFGNDETQIYDYLQ